MRRLLTGEFMTNRREFLLGAAAGSFAVASSAETAGTRALEPQKFPLLSTHITNEMRKARIPGLQVAVIQNGTVTYRENFGLADLENPVAVTSTTLFQVASCTKA